MAAKIDVKSGDPYRDPTGHFGTSPDAKLQEALAALAGKAFVSRDDNKKKIDTLKGDATSKLAALRGGDDTYVDMGSEDKWATQEYIHTLTKKNNLSSRGRDALNFYVNSGFETINAKLRGKDIDDYMESKTSAAIKELDKAFSYPGNSLKENIVTYKGVHSKTPLDLAIGSTMQYEGFYSSSMTQAEAAKFAKAAGENKYILKLNVPSGTKIVLPDNEDVKAGIAENEVILNRGTKIRVNKISRKKIGGLGKVTIIEASLGSKS